MPSYTFTADCAEILNSPPIQIVHQHPIFTHKIRTDLDYQELIHKSYPIALANKIVPFLEKDKDEEEESQRPMQKEPKRRKYQRRTAVTRVEKGSKPTITTAHHSQQARDRTNLKPTETLHPSAKIVRSRARAGSPSKKRQIPTKQTALPIPLPTNNPLTTPARQRLAPPTDTDTDTTLNTTNTSRTTSPNGTLFSPLKPLLLVDSPTYLSRSTGESIPRGEFSVSKGRGRGKGGGGAELQPRPHSHHGPESQQHPEKASSHTLSKHVTVAPLPSSTITTSTSIPNSKTNPTPPPSLPLPTPLPPLRQLPSTLLHPCGPGRKPPTPLIEFDPVPRQIHYNRAEPTLILRYNIDTAALRDVFGWCWACVGVGRLVGLNEDVGGDVGGGDGGTSGGGLGWKGLKFRDVERVMGMRGVAGVLGLRIFEGVCEGWLGGREGKGFSDGVAGVDGAGEERCDDLTVENGEHEAGGDGVVGSGKSEDVVGGDEGVLTGEAETEMEDAGDRDDDEDGRSKEMDTSSLSGSDNNDHCVPVSSDIEMQDATRSFDSSQTAIVSSDEDTANTPLAKLYRHWKTPLAAAV